MLDIFLTSQFKKDYKKIRKTKNVDNLLNVVNLIRNVYRLPAQYRDHNYSQVGPQAEQGRVPRHRARG